MKDLHTLDKYRDRDYVERDALLRKIKRYSLSDGSVLGKHSGAAEELILEVELFPSADVAPVRRGHWKRDRENRPICSECAEEPYRNGDYNLPNYCPNCGAKMEVEHDN